MPIPMSRIPQAGAGLAPGRLVLFLCSLVLGSVQATMRGGKEARAGRGRRSRVDVCV